MAEKTCPICGRMNDESATRCWYCQAQLVEEPILPQDQKTEQLNSQPGDSEHLVENQFNNSSPEPNESVGQEIPDWLARIRARAKEEQETSQEAQEESESESSEEEIPGWLKENLSEENAAQPSAEVEQGQTAEANAKTPPEEERKEWLQKLQAWQAEEFKDEKSGGSAEISVEPAKAPAQSENLEPCSPIETGAPEWMQEVMKEAVSQPPFVSEEAPELAGSENHLEASVTTAETSATAQEEPPQASEEVPSTPKEVQIPAFTQENEPENQAGAIFPSDATAKPFQLPFEGEPLTDWIKESENTHSAEQTPSSLKSEGAEKPLEPAVLPAWMQALKPESEPESEQKPEPEPQPLSEQPIEKVETSGALQGIKGALQGEDLYPLYTQPQKFSNDLTISAAQQARLKILENLNTQAAWEPGREKEKKSSGVNVLRILVAAFLLAGVLISNVPIVSPTLYAPEVVQTFNVVNALPPGKPVLVAAEFDGSLYGELNWSMQPLLLRLIQKNTPMVLLSTNPAGTTLMKNSLGSIAAQYPTYTLNSQVFNLGYLAGGSMGLQSLTQNLRLTLPLDVHLQPVWQSSTLQPIEKVSDFGAVIVVTENADTARFWIEQVQPALGNTPMLVVISAQSAPLLQPYYDSGQIAGFLAGLSSAASFESLDKNPQSAAEHFASYQYGLLIVVFLILAGGITSLLFHTSSNERAGTK